MFLTHCLTKGLPDWVIFAINNVFCTYFKNAKQTKERKKRKTLSFTNPYAECQSLSTTLVRNKK